VHGKFLNPHAKWLRIPASIENHLTGLSHRLAGSRSGTDGAAPSFEVTTTGLPAKKSAVG